MHQSDNAHKGGDFARPNVLDMAQAAVNFADAVTHTRHCKDVLKAGYHAWRTQAENFEYIKRGSVEWDAMMRATAGEYRHLRNAKSRQYRAQQKLLALAKSWEGAL